MNIFVHEFKTYWKSTVVWVLSLVSIVVVFMALFQDAVTMQEVFDSFPEEFLSAFGMSSLDLSSELDYYGFTFTYILLAGAIQAMNLGTSVLSLEVRENTADFLLTKPITRRKIITSKIMAILVHIIITNIVYIASAVFMLTIVKQNSYDGRIFYLISFTLLFIQLFFLSLGLLVSTIKNKIRSVLPISLGTVFGFYILSLINESLDKEILNYFTPFAYFKPKTIIDNGNYELKYIFVCLAIILICTLATYMIYSRKDIPSV